MEKKAPIRSEWWYDATMVIGLALCASLIGMAMYYYVKDRQETAVKQEIYRETTGQ